MTHRTDQPSRQPTLISVAYRLTLAVRFAGMACVMLVLFGLLVFLALNKRLGTGYVTDLATLSGLQDRLPALLWGAGLAYLCAAAALEQRNLERRQLLDVLLAATTSRQQNWLTSAKTLQRQLRDTL